MTGIRAVTFDLWFTLLRDADGEATWRARIRDVAGLLGMDESAAADLVSGGHRRLRAQWREGRALSADEIAAGILASAGRGTSVDAVTELRRCLSRATLTEAVTVLPGAADTLRVLRGSGMPIGLICDTGLTPGEGLRQLLSAKGLGEYFDVLLFSDETGAPKPARRPFRRAEELFGVDPSGLVHVGDLRGKDVTGALGAGWSAVRYRGARDDAPAGSEPDAPWVIDDHAQLLELLGLVPG